MSKRSFSAKTSLTTSTITGKVHLISIDAPMNMGTLKTNLMKRVVMTRSTVTLVEMSPSKKNSLK